MLKDNIWFKGALNISLYISCGIMTMLMCYGAADLFKGNTLPLRMYLVAGIALINWLVIAYYSEEAAWQTLLKLSCYSLALFSMCVSLLGCALIIRGLVDDSIQENTMNSLSLVLAGGLCIYGFVKIGNSKWLNS